MSTLPEDQPFPGMPEPAVLWAVHVEGPDDVIAAVDREEATARATEINAWWEAFKRRPNADPEKDARWHATVIQWPHDPASHAAEVARGAERWTGCSI